MNKVVRKRTKVESLQDKLREWRLKWKGRISGKEDTCVVKVVQGSQTQIVLRAK